MAGVTDCTKTNRTDRFEFCPSSLMRMPVDRHGRDDVGQWNSCISQRHAHCEGRIDYDRGAEGGAEDADTAAASAAVQGDSGQARVVHFVYHVEARFFLN